MSEFILNKDKSINSLLYICQKLGGSWDMYSLLKILYFAEVKHLIKFGRPITGDDMIAMDNGPVPSFSYDEVKLRTCDGQYFDNNDESVVTAKKEPNLRVLSKSEIKCLDESIAENFRLNFGQLKEKSHGTAWEVARQTKGCNCGMSYIDLVKEGAGDVMVKYVADKANFNYWQ